MKDYNTIVGILEFRDCGFSFRTIQKRFQIGMRTIENIVSGYDDLLVFDDFGYAEEVNTKKKPMNYHRLFEVLNAHENRKATIIAAQIPNSDWYDLFRNNTYTDACMDRITKSNFLIELEGPSLR